MNLCDANVRIRCQSVLQDKRDVFLAPYQQFRYRFVDIDRGEPATRVPRLYSNNASLGEISGTQLKCNQARRAVFDLVTDVAAKLLSPRCVVAIREELLVMGD